MEKEVAEIVEKLFQNEKHFMSMYSQNPEKVFGKVIHEMKIVPINLKNILAGFYKELSTKSSDNYI